MKNLLTLAAIFCFTLTAYSQTTWLFDNATTLGDGTSWNDANNWSDQATGTLHQVPAAGDEARLTINNSTITGTVPNIPGNVTVGGSKTVTLDLDITIGDGTGSSHGIVMFNNGILNIAAGRTVTINVPTNKEAVRLNSGKTNTLNIAATAILNIQQCTNGLFIEDATHTITNDGTIAISGATTNGINLIAGTITNNGIINITSATAVDGIEQVAGTLTNSATGNIAISNVTTNGINQTGGDMSNAGTITITTATTNGIDYSSGTLTNNGTVDISGSTGECILVGAVDFANSGTLTLANAGASSGQNCIDISATGKLTNNSGGMISADGGSNNTRCISVVGQLDNEGIITLSGGNTNRSISGDGGTLNNMVCGFIDLGATRFFNASTTFTNNGFIKSTATALAGSGTSTNNGFYAGIANFSPDNGVDVTSGNFTVDAMSGCAVTDIGIDAAYTWFSDMAATTQAGTNDAAGVLTIDNGAYPGTAGTKIAYSCFGTAFTMTINNVDGGCLPVELLFFNGKATAEGTVLNWATASELNNEGFEVQKSANGENWETLGFVVGNGTTLEVQNYDFLDNQPFNRKNYYRLKQIDFDANFEYSNIITINANATANNNTKIYPNPSKGSFNIETLEKTDLIEVYNTVGQKVQTIVPTNSDLIILDDLQKGIYTVRIITGNTATTQQIIKQ